MLPSVFRRNFALVNSGIYFIPEPGADGKYFIQFLNLATGKVKRVATIPRSPVMAGFSVSPDGDANPVRAGGRIQQRPHAGRKFQVTKGANRSDAERLSRRGIRSCLSCFR